MKPGSARQVLQSFSGLERRETLSRFLYTILISLIVIDTVLILLRLRETRTFVSETTWVLIVFLALQFGLLVLVRRGYLDLAGRLLVLLCWLVATALAWRSDGVRDVTVNLYFVILLIAALLTSWRVTFTLAALSIAAIWWFAIAEAQGLRTPHIDPPLSLARDLTAVFLLFLILIYLVVNNVGHSLAAVQASEKKYRNFVEQSIEGIWYLAFDQPIPVQLPVEEQVKLIYQYGYLADCNNVFAQMYGYPTSDEIRGLRLLELQADRVLDPWNHQAMLDLVHDRYRSANRETGATDQNGEKVYFLTNAVGVLADDCLVGLWGTQLDISALKNAEEALRRSEARLRALLNAVPDMIFEFNQDGTILQFIASAINMPLLPPEEFLGKNIGEVLPAVASQTLFSISRALETGNVHAFEYQFFQDGRNRTFEARITPVGPDTVMAMVRDVSLQRWIEEEREKLIVELEKKNAELERFTYTVSHDLKSPLITIRGFLGFIREDSRRGNLTRLDADIQRISAATEKMQALLNDLLELSRVGRLMNELRDIDMNQLVRETLELLHGRISQTGAAVSVAEHLPSVHGDYERLAEVWQNLIDNACKFMGDQAAPRVEIGCQGAEEQMLVFYVRDNGIGIPGQYHDHIFGLFNKLDIHTEGTGIGLALVKRIIEIHGGRIWVESEPGRGTTFFFTLPPAEMKS